MATYDTVPFSRRSAINGTVGARSLGKPSAAYPGQVATDANLMIAVDRQQTKLALTMNAGDTTMTVIDPSMIVANNLLSIDNEIVRTTGNPSGNVVPVARGFDGTTPAIHLIGATVSGFVDAYHHNTLVAEVEAIENALGPNLSKLPASLLVFAPTYDFPPQTPGGSLTPGINQITLSPVPLGINGSNSGHYLYISGGTGAAEAVPITGGSAVSGAPSGNIFVTCANAHSGAWTIRTATAGGQEAMYSTTGPVQVIYPAGNFNMYARLYYPRDQVSVTGLGWAVTTLTWQVNLAGDLMYAAGTGGTSPVARYGIELRNLRIYSTVTQTAGAALHCFACRYPIIYNVNFQGSETVANLYHGVWFDQIDYGYIDRTKVVCTQECVRINGSAGGGLKAGVFISNALLSSSGVGIHVGGAFGGLYVTTSDIIGNATGLLVDNALAAEDNREILLEGTTSIDSSTVTGIDLAAGMGNGYLGLSGPWLASNRIGLRVRSGVGPFTSIVYSGGRVFNHTTAGIQNESDQAVQFTMTGTMVDYNAIGINQTVATAGAAQNFLCNNVRFNQNNTNVSGEINTAEVTLANGNNNDVNRYNVKLVRIIGPTAAFAITGFAGGKQGDLVVVQNATAFAMTIRENSVLSAAGNRILTFQGDMTLRVGSSAVTLMYSVGTWIVTGYN